MKINTIHISLKLKRDCFFKILRSILHKNFNINLYVSHIRINSNFTKQLKLYNSKVNNIYIYNTQPNGIHNIWLQYQNYNDSTKFSNIFSWSYFSYLTYTFKSIIQKRASRFFRGSYYKNICLNFNTSLSYSVSLFRHVFHYTLGSALRIPLVS